MTPIRIDEKFLAEHPHLAERIRQVEEKEKQTGNTASQICPAIDEPERPNVKNILAPPEKARKSNPTGLYFAIGLLGLMVYCAVVALGHTTPASQPVVSQAQVIMSQGSSGQDVAQLQQDLDKVLGWNIATDGDYGPLTVDAVKNYQTQAGLPATGAVDQTTWQDLQTQAAKVKTQVATVQPAQSQPNQATPKTTTTAQTTAPTVTNQPSTASAQSASANTSTSSSFGYSNEFMNAQGQGYTISVQWAGPGLSGFLHYVFSGMKDEDMVIVQQIGSDTKQIVYRGTYDQCCQVAAALSNLPPSAFMNTAQPPLYGEVVDDRLPITVGVSNSSGIYSISGAIDSGSQMTAFPDSFLRNLGYTPIASSIVQGVTGTGTDFLYEIPPPMVLNNGKWEPVCQGMLKVWGMPNYSGALIGADVLKNLSLSVNGGMFVLAFPQ